MLIEAIERSMRAFWDFLRADKDVNSLRRNRVDLQNPADVELLMDIQTDLQKVCFQNHYKSPNFSLFCLHLFTFKYHHCSILFL